MSKSILGLLFAMFFAFPSRAEQPIFTLTSLDANPGEIIEINFNVDDFTNIFSIQFSVSWNPDVIQFRAIKNLNTTLTNLNQTNFNIDSAGTTGQVGFGWFDATIQNPVTLPDGSRVFTFEFEVIGAPCQNTPVAITNEPTEIEASDDGINNIGLVAHNGSVTIPGTGCTEGINLIGNSIVAACGSEACIEFTIENFAVVGFMEFSLAYDITVLQFTRFQNYAPLPAFANGSTFESSPGNLRVVWTHPNAENSSLPDGTTLFEICFDVIGAGGQSSSITFGNDPPPSIGDNDNNEHEFIIQPAVITAQCAIEGFALIVEDSVCTEPGGLACIDIQVNDFEEMLVMQFSMNWDSTRFEFSHVESFNLSGLDQTLFAAPPDVDQGQLALSWFDPDFEGITLPDGTSIFTVCLRAIGPAESASSFSFSGIPSEIEFATIDSTLTTYGLLPANIQIQEDCDVIPCSINYTLSVTHPGCPGQSNGAIDLTVNTGNCPDTPTYLWSNDLTTQDISGLAAGPYSVTITLGSLIVVATDTLVNPAPIGVSANITHPIPPNTPTGAINITVTGGTPPYSYNWNTIPSTNEDLNNLLPGTYIVTVTDSRGCTFVPDPFIVGADLVGSITHASCPGSCNGSITATPSFGTPPYTYSWNTVPVQTTATINNLCPGTYCVTVTDSQGSTRNACFIVDTQTPPINVTATLTHDNNENGTGAIDLHVTGGTNPITYIWSPGGQTTQDLINLSQGEYCVTITYGLSCTFNTCFDIFAGGIGVSLTATQYGNFQTSCNNICDGEIFSSVSGGTPPFTYLWSNNATTPDLANLCPGIYSLTVTDATGNSSSSSRTIVAPPALTFTTIETDPTDITLSDGSIAIIANGGVPPYTYEWIGSPFGAKNNLPYGTYPITVIDANGCEVSGFGTLDPGGECLKANTIITPNNDGKNDFFFIRCIFDADNHLFIFNRQGGLVYDTQNYTNNWTGVDGDNQPIADGGYMWVLEFENPDGTTRILKGTVNVLRTAD